MKQPILTLLLLSCFSHSVISRTVYVNTAANGLNEGTSWQDAYTKLLPALINAQYGDSLWIAQGTYKRTTAESWDVAKGVSLFGGFQGNETQLSQRNPSLYETILAGTDRSQFLNPPIPNEYSWHVLYLNEPDENNYIEGLTITGGSSINFPFGSEKPCGFFASQGRNCYGGGIYIYSSNPSTDIQLSIKNAIIRENNVNGIGGGGIGIYAPNNRLRLLIEGCQFLNNSAFSFEKDYQEGMGGGLYVENNHPNSEVLISHCTFQKNSNGHYWSSPSLGAAITAILGPENSVKIENCIFFGNNGYNETGNSTGGIVIDGGKNHLIKNCQFKVNKGGAPLSFRPSGGVSALHTNRSLIENCYFIGNESRLGPVGGNDNVYQNCLFYKNIAKSHSGVYTAETLQSTGVQSGSATFRNCTIIGNTAGEYGGFSFIRSITFELNLINNIFLENTATKDSTSFLYRLISPNIQALNVNAKHNAFLDYKNIDSVYAATTGIIQISELNNLYEVEPEFVLSDTLDYRLGACSPLLNMGLTDSLSQEIGLLDLDGNPRILNGLPDLGAWEAFEFDPYISPIDSICIGTEANVALNINNFPNAQILWSNNGSSNLTNTVPLGNHQVIASADNSCIDTITFSVYANSAEILSSTLTSTPAEPTNGTASVMVSGGTPPYQFIWSNQETSANIENLPYGNYGVTITDSNGCSMVDSVQVSLISRGTSLKNENSRLFPNPNTGVFTVITTALPSDSKTVTAVDVLGRKWLLSANSTHNATQWEVSAKNLPSGRYWLRGISDGLMFVIQ